MKQVKFLILSDPRSGTMMLTDSLDEDRRVKMFNLYASNPDNPAGYHRNWLRFQDKVEPRVTHRGTTMHRVGDGWIRNLSPLPPDQFWQTVRDRHDLHVCLHRENLLRRFLSRKVGVILRGYGVHAPRDKDPGPVRLPIQELMEFVGNTHLLQEQINQYFPDRLIVRYEDLATKWDLTFLAVQNYLGLPATGIEPVTIRQERRLLKVAIENYEEVKSYLTNKGWGHWLDD